MLTVDPEQLAYRRLLSADDGRPELYVFPDPVTVDTPTPETAGAEPEPTDASGPGLGALTALVGVGSFALGARRAERE
jgi:hypothetical protein